MNAVVGTWEIAVVDAVRVSDLKFVAVRRSLNDEVNEGVCEKYVDDALDLALSVDPALKKCSSEPSDLGLLQPLRRSKQSGGVMKMFLP